MHERRILVVGTTPDYIAYIHKRYPGRALFLTDQALRDGSSEIVPDKAGEVTCDLDITKDVSDALYRHLKKRSQSLSGVVCYDCERLTLAAELADFYDLPFPSVESVRLSRNKYLTKKIWTENGIGAPGAELVNSLVQARTLIERFGGPVVLKPLIGTGSELTFRCDNVHDAVGIFRIINERLTHRMESHMSQLGSKIPAEPISNTSILAEEFVEGREYSADFIIDGDNVLIIRVAKKLYDTVHSFGTALAYVVPATLPGHADYGILADTLRRAGQALGLSRAIGMVDFKISRDEIILLELTPRIGGDCLPPLIRKSGGFDTIGLALDFAEGRKIDLPPLQKWTEHIGMRLLARQGGKLLGVYHESLDDNPRVREICITRSPGHEIILPPDDYDSRVLGYVIFEPAPNVHLRKQCNEMTEKILIDVEQNHNRKYTRISAESVRAAQSSGPAA